MMGIEFLICNLKVNEITESDIVKVEKIFKVHAMLNYMKRIDDKNLIDYDDFKQQLWLEIMLLLNGDLQCNNGLFMKIAIERAIRKLNKG